MSNSIIRVLLTGDAAGLERAAADSTKSLEKTGKASGTAGGSIKAGLAIGAGAAIAFGVDSIKAYMGAEEAQTRLEVAIKNSGSTWAAHKQAIDAAVSSGQAFGYDQGQIMAALAQMTTSFGSPTKALDTLQLAENLAALKGMSLSDASMLVTKGLEGQIRPLKALGLDLPVTTAGAFKLQTAQTNLAKAEANLTLIEQQIHDGRLKGPAATTALASANDKLTTAHQKLATVEGTVSIIQGALTKDTAGAASAAADTLSGKLAAQEAAWRNVKIEAGKALSNGLIAFQVWSEKTGRPEIMRLQGDVHSLALEFSSLADFAVPAVDSITTSLAGLDKALGNALGSALSDVGNAFGLGGSSGQGTPGAAAADKARLDAINRANAQHSPAHPTGHPGPSPSVAVTVNVHSANPAAVIAAINTFARRNGVQ